MNTKYGVMYQLRLSTRFQRKTIGLGSDHIQALNLALMVDEEITRLIAIGDDIDIDKLKALVQTEQQKLKVKKTGAIKLVEKDDLSVLWEKYVKFHVSINHWTDSYLLSHINTVGNLIRNCPYQTLEEKSGIVEWFFTESSKRTIATSKERFKLVVAAIDWNSKQGNIPRKWGIEYRDLLESISIKTEKKSNIQSEEDLIDIFSVEEVYKILEALKNETYSRFEGKHRQYYPYAYFLWLTGCRPSEAVALKWHNVDLAKKRIKICEVEMSRNGHRLKRQGTKTVSYRYFPINPELEKLFDLIGRNGDYVFRNDKNKPINHSAFYSVWQGVLKAMGIRYRTPYQLRHTMISYHCNNDYPVHKLAELVGNSEAVIKEHYLRLDIERITLPDVIKA